VKVSDIAAQVGQVVGQSCSEKNLLKPIYKITNVLQALGLVQKLDLFVTWQGTESLKKWT